MLVFSPTICKPISTHTHSLYFPPCYEEQRTLLHQRPILLLFLDPISSCFLKDFPQAPYWFTLLQEVSLPVQDHSSLTYRQSPGISHSEKLKFIASSWLWLSGYQPIFLFPNYKTFRNIFLYYFISSSPLHSWAHSKMPYDTFPPRKPWIRTMLNAYSRFVFQFKMQSASLWLYDFSPAMFSCLGSGMEKADNQVQPRLGFCQLSIKRVRKTLHSLAMK